MHAALLCYLCDDPSSPSLLPRVAGSGPCRGSACGQVSWISSSSASERTCETTPPGTRYVPQLLHVGMGRGTHTHCSFSPHTYNHPCAWYMLCARTLTTATHPIPITIHVLGICCVLARSLVPYLYPSMCLVSAVSSLAHYSYSSHTYNYPCA